MHRFEQLFTIMLALKFRVNTQQRQHVHGIARYTGQHGLMVFQVTPGTTQAGTEHHAQLPCPAFSDVQTPHRRRDQGHPNQPIIDQQAQPGAVLQKMLFDQFTHRRPDPLFVTRTVCIEQKAERRFMPISLIQQRPRLARVTAIEQLDLACSNRRLRHDVLSPWRRLDGGASSEYEPPTATTVPSWRMRTTLAVHLPYCTLAAEASVR